MKTGLYAPEYRSLSSFIRIFPGFGCIAHLVKPTELFCTASPNRHEEIRAGEQHVELAQVLVDSFVSHLSVTEGSFHNLKSMLHLAANG